MKLGKLLAAGKSIMNGHAEISYRSSKQIYLPKFGSAKNPFEPQAAPSREATAEESSSSDSDTSLKEAARSEAPPSEPTAAPRPTRLAKPETSTAAPVKKTIATKTEKISAFPPVKKGWASKFNPISLFRPVSAKNEKKAGPSLAKTQRPAALQAELSLDTVRVVHNDLSDVDVEVVPMKSRSAPPELQPAKKSWEFLGERLFGVEAT